jgi:SAM-dependent methyltransferase
MPLGMLVKKILRKLYYSTIRNHYNIDRFFRYRRPREYWIKRGGNGYFHEQEAVQHRTLRSEFIAEEIKKLKFQNLLEVGCGYGKQIKNLSHACLQVVGCDYSRSQLRKAQEYCYKTHVQLVEADAEQLPFQDKSFDMVMTSAVILHNPTEKARKIISEIIRVSRKYLVHNEDTDITFSRYGYDLTKTYEAMGFSILVSKPIPIAPDPSITQFTIAEIPDGSYKSMTDQVFLMHH